MIAKFFHSLFSKWNLYFYWLVLFFSSLGLSFSHAGSISGRVLYNGPIPPAIEQKVTRDSEFCGEKRLRKPIRIHTPSNGVPDAVVSLQSTPSLKHNPQDQGPVITNHDCTFVPHIITTPVHESLELRNDDPILHNTHIRNGKKTFINVALVVEGLPIRKRIKKPGLMKVACDAHKFMQAYILAFDHPFYSMTNPSGNFQISGVPPGQHKLDVWHEFLGTLTVSVEVPTEGDVSITIKFPTP